MDNLEVLIPALLVVIDVIVGALPNKWIRYKGIVLKIITIIGNYADDAREA